MNIETKWLKDFLSLAKTQSFSRSAEARHVTQPAFGRRIRALEDALGCILIDRTSVPVKLTPAGQLFCLTAQNLVQQLDDCVEHLQSLQRRGPEVIDFAVSHTLVSVAVSELSTILARCLGRRSNAAIGRQCRRQCAGAEKRHLRFLIGV